MLLLLKGPLIFSFGKVCPKKVLLKSSQHLASIYNVVSVQKRVDPLYKLFCTAQACSPAAQKIKGLSLSTTTKSGQNFLQKGYLFKILLHKKQSLVHKPKANVTGRAVFSTESSPNRCYGICTLKQHFSILSYGSVLF